MKTQLKNRILWYDGTSQVDPDLIPDLMVNGLPLENICITHHNSDSLQFNTLSEDYQLNQKSSNKDFDFSWKIPTEYQNINLEEILEETCIEYCYLNKLDHHLYYERLYAELKEIKNRHIEPLFKTIFYLINTLYETQVFGIGRGSSCASLVLFLLGLHKIDPVKYDISMEEFFHD